MVGTDEIRIRISDAPLEWVLAPLKQNLTRSPKAEAVA
jgi:hypothetical protein